jgi:DUF2934 family protein
MSDTVPTNQLSRRSGAKAPSAKSPKTKPAARTAPASVKVEGGTTTRARRTSKSGIKADSRRVSAEERRQMIEVSAYYRAERRGFTGGSAVDDWLAAEIEVDRLLAMKATSRHPTSATRTG